MLFPLLHHQLTIINCPCTNYLLYKILQQHALLNFNNQGKGAVADQVWDGYMDLQRAEGHSLQIRMMKDMEKENDLKAQGKQSEEDIDWVETDVDKLLKQLDETQYKFQCKTLSDKRTTNFIYASGYSTTGGLGTGNQD